MRILYVCHRFPFPPNSGSKVRAFNMIRHLHACGHEVTVASLAHSAKEADEGRAIASYCAAFEVGIVSEASRRARAVLRLPTLHPSSMGYFYSPRLARRVTALLHAKRWNLVFVHCSSVAPYVLNATDVPKILDFCDMDSQKWIEYARRKPFPLSWGYALEGYKMLRAEKRLAQCFDLCTTATRAELQTLESYDTGVAADWFPNGVDSHYFSPADGAHDIDTISFIGRMDYYPNQECMTRFCDQVWPLIKSRRPAMKLLIVGADPPPQIRALERLPGVTVTGSVPDVRPYVRSSALTVAPLAVARGTQNKILEAMAMGVPVVTSSIAAGGVDAEPEKHFLVADTAEETARAVLRVVEHGDERSRLAASGRERMLSHHAWPRSMQRLDRIIEQALRVASSQRASLASAA